MKVPGSGAGARSCSRRFREGSGSTRFHRRFWKALVESEARFNEVPEGAGEAGSTTFRKRLAEKVPEKALARTRFRKVSEKVSGDVGAKPGQVQRGYGRSGEGFGEGSGTPWCRGGPGSSRFRCDSGSVLAQL